MRRVDGLRQAMRGSWRRVVIAPVANRASAFVHRAPMRYRGEVEKSRHIVRPLVWSNPWLFRVWGDSRKPPLHDVTNLSLYSSAVWSLTLSQLRRELDGHESSDAPPQVTCWASEERVLICRVDFRIPTSDLIRIATIPNIGVYPLHSDATKLPRRNTVFADEWCSCAETADFIRVLGVDSASSLRYLI